MGMDIEPTHTQHLVSCIERPNLLATEGPPPRRNFSSGALVPQLFLDYLYKLTHGAKVAAPKVLHGLIAAGTDIWVLELSRRTLGERYVPATVRMPRLPLIVF